MPALLEQLSGFLDGGQPLKSARSFAFATRTTVGQMTPTTDAEGNRIKGKDRGFAKKRAMSARALVDLGQWLKAAG